jgi:hypothetical protein
VRAVIVDPFTTVTFVAAVPPKLTVAPDWKPTPVSVTNVFPAVVPVPGSIAVTEIGDGTKNVNWLAPAAELPDGVVTITSKVPAPWAGVVAVILVSELTAYAAPVPPNVMDEAPAKFVPVSVTVVPPLVVPAVGLIPVMAGGGGGAAAVENDQLDAAVSAFPARSLAPIPTEAVYGVDAARFADGVNVMTVPLPFQVTVPAVAGFIEKAVWALVWSIGSENVTVMGDVTGTLVAAFAGVVPVTVGACVSAA